MTELRFTNAGFGYGARPVLGRFDLALAPAGLTALVGPNGAGKSTCLKLAAGLLEPSGGRVQLEGRSVAAMPPRERARRIAYLASDGRLAWPMPAEAVVALGRVPWRQPLRALGEADKAAIEAAMRRTGVTQLADRRFDTLSSGEKARVLMARVLAVGAGLIVLDEPTAALDVRHQLELMDILKAEARNGAQILVAVHALDLAARYADRVLVMQEGRLVADGPAHAALGEAVVRDVFGVEAPGGIQPTELGVTPPA